MRFQSLCVTFCPARVQSVREAHVKPGIATGIPCTAMVGSSGLLRMRTCTSTATVHAMAASTIGGGILYVILCIAIGFYGTKKGLSLWMGLLVSLLLTPLIGFIVVVFEKDKSTGRRGLVTW
jgi:hypothetical protein